MLARVNRLAIFFITTAYAKHKGAWYRDQWCAAHHENRGYFANSQSGRLHNTDPHRGDRICKQVDSIGQNLDYAMQANKRLGIVLVPRKEKKYRYWLMLNSAIKEFHRPMDTWLVK